MLICFYSYYKTLKFLLYFNLFTHEEGGEGNDRGWDGWMASSTPWTWVWVSSKSWWWTGRPDVLQSMGLQRVKHDWATKLNWIKIPKCILLYFSTKMFKHCLLDLVCLWYRFHVFENVTYNQLVFFPAVSVLE